MNGYSAVLEALRRAGGAARGASDTIAGVDAAGSLPSGEAGMPGARIIGLVDSVRTTWRTRTADLVSGFSEVSGAFSQAAQHYETNDEAARADLREAAGGRRPV
ncbi:hypothetical protein [Amycolatopsis magusensis]|uniref:Excreted virulence factor EspC, type VII ESX diderm n=1 Tax=Amycolatopsis magusensis TaxID=882444 RepID=A0ABS4Q461_9PSEU|nr:hypothetical protein [Amycolatopsis magusensis]MBP2186471.1 hypothetical protein [Amycolatopsis magusensis]MDI5976055.1 hypothetical protein [Amycolatopsis magusensis]